MKKFLSLCLCMACMLSFLAGCGGEPTVRDAQKEKPIQDAGHVEELHGATGTSATFPPKLDEGADEKTTEPTDAEKPNKEEKSVSQLERAKNVFLRLESKDANILYSPLSMEMALGLLSEGAESETREELLKFLGTEDYSKIAKDLLTHVEEHNKEGQMYDDMKTALNLANSLWVDKDYTIRSDFLGVAEDSYDATSKTLNFNQPVESAQAVNDWCAEKTNGLIKQVLKPDAITPELALILCNSLYFESPWWEPWGTDKGQFTNADGKEVNLVDMLYSTEKLYYETDNAVAFGKQYVSGSTFIGILPDEGKTLTDIDLNKLLASRSKDYDVHASMPKLNYDFTCEDFVKILSDLGVVRAFTPDAQLGGLVNESDELYVSDVLQKCKIELDEKGTKAAAVTVIMTKDNAVMIEEPPVVKEVHLDRPFYYLIVDDATEQVLFIGAVNSVEA